MVEESHGWRVGGTGSDAAASAFRNFADSSVDEVVSYVPDFCILLRFMSNEPGWVL